MSEETTRSCDRSTDPGPSPPALTPTLTRRQVVVGATALLGGLALPAARLRAADPFTFSEPLRRALEGSPLVYVSPLRGNGAESSCHGEVWYFVDEGAVVIMTATDGWKVRSTEKGSGQARLWVGNFGPIGKAGDRYRQAPSFRADAEIVTDRAVFDRLLASFGERYRKEWGKWKPRFEKGWSDGSRKVIRYKPVAD